MKQENLTVVNLDLQSSFITAMLNEGLEAHHDINIEADGQLKRFRVKGDKSGSKNGWYVLFGGKVVAGTFGNWKSGLINSWSAKNINNMTKKERFELKIYRQNAIRVREQQRVIEQHKVAIECGKIWENAQLSVDEQHPYLQAKRIKAFGIRQINNNLILPVQNAQNKLVSLQTITPSGIKMFKAGGKVSGCFMVIGDLKGTVFVCEGYATGVTIHQATQKSVIVAFNAGNLEPAIYAIKTANFEDINLIIAADNDHQSSNNVGLVKAAQCAKKFNLNYVYPTFSEQQKGSDFNDLYELVGLDAVSRFFKNAIKELC